METTKKRAYAAQVKLQFVGTKKVRYLKTQRQAVSLFRDVNHRLMQAGRPTRPATITPVHGWQGVIDPAHLTVSSSGSVVVHRKAKTDDFRIAAPVWPATGVQP